MGHFRGTPLVRHWNITYRFIVSRRRRCSTPNIQTKLSRNIARPVYKIKSGRSLNTHTLITRCLCGLNANWFHSQEWIITKTRHFDESQRIIGVTRNFRGSVVSWDACEGGWPPTSVNEVNEAFTGCDAVFASLADVVQVRSRQLPAASYSRPSPL
ncbi:unnamed protein product [Callosobruchus maculatus]|uniref:Uncharacterized protein n=1 Tax=Callosobruchus maculatus TaxID=64391 RepID=A0A653CQK3_CALMS|nr:unnamed protein product [Callosobruchus maculatus]